MSTVVKSKGLLGLSHYRSSRISTSLAEPIYLNLFTVQIDPPVGLGLTAQSEDVLLMLEGVQKVSGLDSDIFPETLITQKYKWAERSFAGAAPNGTHLDLVIDFALNMRPDSDTPDNFTYKFLRKWNDLIYDPMTGRQGIKKDYVAPSMTITMQDRSGTPFWQWICYNVFPTKALKGPQLDYSSTQVLNASQTFRCDYWDECML